MESELRNKYFLPIKYKKRECIKFISEGYCPYGIRCQFINSQGNHIIKYEKIIEILRNKSEVFFSFLTQKETKKARRLSFF